LIVTAGELLVEFVSHSTGCGLQTVTTYSGPYPSGAPAIFIDQAARMGAATQILGSVGNDPFGRSLVARLQGDGVDTSGVQILPNATTGTAFVSYFEDGSRVFVFHIANTAADQIPAASPPKGPFTAFVSGASLGIASARTALLALCDAARASGGTVCCDPNIRPELLGDPAIKDALDHIIGQCDIVLPSEADLAFLYPDLTPEAGAQALLARGVRLVVLKMGKLGVRLIGDGHDLHLPAHKVTEVDPTGAGDCFCGTFLGLLDTGHDVETALRHANAAGALHVTERGPMELNPTIAQIRALLAKDDAHAN
jgi:sugar/nucleoside kinase (ribokinase family)